jgi:hypothetical protein
MCSCFGQIMRCLHAKQRVGTGAESLFKTDRHLGLQARMAARRGRLQENDRPARGNCRVHLQPEPRQ